MHKPFDLSKRDRHLSDEALTRFFEKELPGEEREMAEKHIDVCWSCRSRLARIEDTISAFINYKDIAYGGPWAEAPGNFKLFSARLEKVLAEPGLQRAAGPAPSFPRNYLGWSWRYWLRPMAVTASVILIVIVLLVHFANIPVMSASVLLQRAASSEEQQIRSVSRPVVHQRLHLKRVQITTNREWVSDVECWTDRSGSRFHVTSSQPGLMDDLRQIYLANELDVSMPLSAAAFGHWRDSLPSKTDDVEKQGGVVTLTTTSNENASGLKIEKAQLRVRASDWHPIGQTIRTNDQEYGISEEQFEVLPLASVAQSIFAEPVAIPPAVAPPPVAPREVEARPMLPSPMELAVAEVDARMALHRLAADLGEPIDVARTGSGEVEVNGLADSPQRKLELIQALQDIPYVAVKIQSLEEASRNSPPAAVAAEGQSTREGSNTPLAKPKGVGPENSETMVLTTRLPIQRGLENYFTQQQRRTLSEKDAASAPTGIQQQIADLSNNAMKFSNGALWESWALRRLAQRYSADELAKLPVEARQKMETIIRDHVKTLHEQVKSADSLLSPVLLSVIEEDGGQPGNTAFEAGAPGVSSFTWPGLPWRLIDEVSQMDRLINGLFAGAGLPLEGEEVPEAGSPLRLKSPERCSADLLASFQRLVVQLREIEKLLAGEFLKNE